MFDLIVRLKSADAWCKGAYTAPPENFVRDSAPFEAADVIEMLQRQIDALRADAERYRNIVANATITSEHWGGRWSIVIDGPSPKNGGKAAIDVAVDAMKEPR